MTYWPGNVFCNIDHVWGESTGGFHSQRAIDMGLRCFLYCKPEQDASLTSWRLRDALLSITKSFLSWHFRQNRLNEYHCCSAIRSCFFCPHGHIDDKHIPVGMQVECTLAITSDFEIDRFWLGRILCHNSYDMRNMLKWIMFCCFNVSRSGFINLDMTM